MAHARARPTAAGGSEDSSATPRLAHAPLGVRVQGGALPHPPGSGPQLSSSLPPVKQGPRNQTSMSQRPKGPLGLGAPRLPPRWGAAASQASTDVPKGQHSSGFSNPAGRDAL